MASKGLYKLSNTANITADSAELDSINVQLSEVEEVWLSYQEGLSKRRKRVHDVGLDVAAH